MIELLRNVLQPDPVQGLLSLLAAFLLYLVLGLLPAVGVLYLIYFLLTLPMRRNERARLFVDLLELGFKDGRTPEAAVTEAASSRDRVLGARFHRLAEAIGQGMRLGRALDQVPRLLPPQLTAMLKAGERLGDVSKVLPACRLLLQDGTSHVRGALNYVLVLAFAVTPFTLVVPIVLKVKVLPLYRAVFQGMLEGTELPAFTRFVLGGSTMAILIQVVLLSLVWLAAIAYLGGPRMRSWLELVMPSAARALDWLHIRLPWRRKRLQRDFSAMLGILLEASVPEAEAVTLAADTTDNSVFRRRAERTALLLKQGVKLPEAIRRVDESGELNWRLANAGRSEGGFVRALAGWYEALDAKAFQLEQTAAQLVTTFLVLLNGVMVGSFVIGLFLALIQLINQATLW